MGSKESCWRILSTYIKNLVWHLNACLEGEKPQWMTKGRTVLTQKDKSKRNEARNYHPITCLPLTWKLFTGMIIDKIYGFLVNEWILRLESLNMMGIAKDMVNFWENDEFLESGTRLWYWDTQGKTYKERDFSRECAITVAACNFHHTSDTYIKNS